MHRRISTTPRSVRWFVVLALLAWSVSANCLSSSDRYDALIQTSEDIEESDFLELLNKSRVRRLGNDIEPVQQFFVRELHSSHLEDSFLAGTAHRLMFVRLTPETGPPILI